jgi:putative hydrolase of the HAD superfamily
MPDAAIIDQMIQVYRCHSPDIVLPADASYCLQTLKKSAKIAIITDGLVETQRSKCRSLSLPALVDIIIYTGEWGPEYYKPNPYAFLSLQEQLGPSVSHFVYVADNPAKDFQAPLQLGWKVVRIRRPGGLHSSRAWQHSEQPHFDVQDLWNLPELLLKQTQTGLRPFSPEH